MVHSSSSSSRNTNVRSTNIILNPNDVLMGRGDWIVRYEGNVQFRNLIRTYRDEFGSVCGRIARNKIALHMIHIITNKGGRFLRRVETSGKSVTGKQANGPYCEGMEWVIVDHKIVMRKVKQAFRDKDSWAQNAPNAMNNRLMSSKIGSALIPPNQNRTTGVLVNNCDNPSPVSLSADTERLMAIRHRQIEQDAIRVAQRSVDFDRWQLLSSVTIQRQLDAIRAYQQPSSADVAIQIPRMLLQQQQPSLQSVVNANILAITQNFRGREPDLQTNILHQLLQQQQQQS